MRRLTPALLLLLGLLAGTTVPAAANNPFVDVPGALDGAVDWAHGNNFVAGVGNRFEPNDPMTRGVLVRALHRMAGRPTGHPAHGLSDVPAGLDSAVRWALDEGIVSAFGDHTFRPNRGVTRGGTARILFAFVAPGGPFEPNGFSDVPPALDPAVDWLVEDPGDPYLPIATGFGDNTFRPNSGATRGQVTRMLFRHHLLAEPSPSIDVTPVQSGLSIPWGLDFTPDGTMLFTERPGTMSALAPPYTGTPTALATDFLDDGYVNGETGLLDLQVSPDFATDRKVFTCQGVDPAGAAAPRVRLVTWTIDGAFTEATRADDPLIDNLTVWGQQGRHGGCRLEFGADGNLWIGTGDGADEANPQNLNRLGGKVLRVDPDTGLGVPGNPFFGRPGAGADKQRIYNYGHRNVQGLTLRPGTSQMFSVEHGTFRDDEINLMVAGGNYGWSPGAGYDESPLMTDLDRFPNAVVAKWSSGNPTIAPSGADWIEGADWGAWDGAMAVGILAAQHLRVMFFSASGELVRQDLPAEFQGADPYGRIRTVTMGPDGCLYVTTANGGGTDQILRVNPVL